MPFKSPKSFNSGLTVQLVKITDIKSSATGIGECNGCAAVQFTVSFANNGQQTVSLKNVVVSIADTANTPFSPDDGDTQGATGSLAPGFTTTGTYAAYFPASWKKPNVTIDISYSATEPTVVLTGPVS